MANFGNKFRMARENKKLSLDDVSKVTKIGTRMLKAIEEEHFEILPGGVFNKGFIRTYARHLGMDDERAIADYLECLLQAESDAASAVQPQHPGRETAPSQSRLVETKRSAPQPDSPVDGEELPHLQLPRIEDIRPRRRTFSDGDGFPWRLMAVAAVVVVLGIFVWTRHSHSGRPASVHAAAPATASSTAAVAPPTATSPGATAAMQNPAAPHSVKLSSQTSTAAARSFAPDSVAENLSPRNPATQSATPSAPRTSDKPPATLSLVIRAAENSWISVVADGQPGLQETLIAPARTTVRASNEITVRVGNAAGVSFVWNGHEVPPDGAESEVKTFTFDASGIHTPPPTPSTAQSQ